MLILGLTGSIGMGKSTTAKLFIEAGVPVYDADAAVHQLYEGEAAPVIEAAFPGTTANGKVDRKALPAPDHGPAEERYVAPRTPVEEVLAAIWAEVLGAASGVPPTVVFSLMRSRRCSLRRSRG